MTYLVKPATWLTGYIPDLPTPFDEDDRLDLAAFARHVDDQVENGPAAVFVACGRVVGVLFAVKRMLPKRHTA